MQRHGDLWSARDLWTILRMRQKNRFCVITTVPYWMRRLWNNFFIRKPERRPATLRPNFHSLSDRTILCLYHGSIGSLASANEPSELLPPPLKDCLKFNRHVRRLPSGKWIIRPFSTGRLRDRTRRQSQLLRCLLSCSSRCSISRPREPYRRTARAHRFVLLR